ncbi:hypothetical protein Vretimale_12838, partial [Volvox reticuliferus]
LPPSQPVVLRPWYFTFRFTTGRPLMEEGSETTEFDIQAFSRDLVSALAAYFIIPSNQIHILTTRVVEIQPPPLPPPLSSAQLLLPPPTYTAVAASPLIADPQPPTYYSSGTATRTESSAVRARTNPYEMDLLAESAVTSSADAAASFTATIGAVAAGGATAPEPQFEVFMNAAVNLATNDGTAAGATGGLVTNPPVALGADFIESWRVIDVTVEMATMAPAPLAPVTSPGIPPPLPPPPPPGDRVPYTAPPVHPANAPPPHSSASQPPPPPPPPPVVSPPPTLSDSSSPPPPSPLTDGGVPLISALPPVAAGIPLGSADNSTGANSGSDSNVYGDSRGRNASQPNMGNNGGGDDQGGGGRSIAAVIAPAVIVPVVVLAALAAAIYIWQRPARAPRDFDSFMIPAEVQHPEGGLMSDDALPAAAAGGTVGGAAAAVVDPGDDGCGDDGAVVTTAFDGRSRRSTEAVALSPATINPQSYSASRSSSFARVSGPSSRATTDSNGGGAPAAATAAAGGNGGPRSIPSGSLRSMLSRSGASARSGEVPVNLTIRFSPAFYMGDEESHGEGQAPGVLQLGESMVREGAARRSHVT